MKKMIEKKALSIQSETNQKQVFVHVIGHSMYPTLKDGDWIPINVIQRGTPLNLGMIIAYHRSDEIVIHRIIKRITVFGSNFYQTKGDNNKKRDKYLVNCKDVIGAACFLEHNEK